MAATATPTQFSVVPRGVTPRATDILRQPNDISRGAYTMDPIPRRLVFLAMSQVQIGQDGDMCVEMSVSDILSACRMQDCGKSREKIWDSVRYLRSQTIETTDDAGNKQVFGWIYFGKENRGKGTISLELDSRLKPYILDFRDRYAELSTSDFSRLTSRHSIRLFELIMSQSGFEGVNGNPPGTWFLKLEVGKLRHHLAIKDDQYPRMTDFRVNVVESPICEINQANIGISIDVEAVKDGRTISHFVFTARKVRRTAPQLDLRLDDEGDKLSAMIENYHEQFSLFFEEELGNTSSPAFGLMSADSQAEWAHQIAVDRLQKWVASGRPEA